MTEFVRDFDGETPILRLGDVTVSTVPELLAAAPPNPDAETVAELALAVNHLVHGTAFGVILEPKSFAESYRARHAREDSPGLPRALGRQIALYTLPALDLLTAPQIDGRKLVYCAENRALGFPYRVEIDLDAPGQSVAYEPLPTT